MVLIASLNRLTRAKHNDRRSFKEYDKKIRAKKLG
jgi:hypothetical protein